MLEPGSRHLAATAGNYSGIPRDRPSRSRFAKAPPTKYVVSNAVLVYGDSG